MFKCLKNNKFDHENKFDCSKKEEYKPFDEQAMNDAADDFILKQDLANISSKE